MITPGTWEPGARVPLGSVAIPGSAVAPRTLASGMVRLLLKAQSLSRPSITTTRSSPSMRISAMSVSFSGEGAQALGQRGGGVVGVTAQDDAQRGGREG